MTDMTETAEDFEAAFDASLEETGQAPAQEASKSKPSGKKPARRATGADAQVRSHIERYLEVAAMDRAQLETVGELLDAGDDPVDVAVALCSPRKNVKGITSLLSLMELHATNPKRATLTIMGMSRDERSPVWKTLGILGFAERRAIDPHELNASEHVDDAIEAHAGEIDRVRALAALIAGGQ